MPTPTQIDALPAASVVNDADNVPVQQSGITKRATAAQLARPASGTAGGVLSGSYPNPGFAVPMATAAALAAEAATRAADDATTAGFISAEASARSGADAALSTAISTVSGGLATHIADTANPHATTAAQVGALAAANNLSDLADAATARANLGITDPTVLPVGTGPGTVASGNDPRFPTTTIRNLASGTATLVSGAKTVTASQVTATCHIFLTRKNAGGTLGDVSEDSAARAIGSSFSIKSYQPGTAGTVQTADTSVVSWLIVEP